MTQTVRELQSASKCVVGYRFELPGEDHFIKVPDGVYRMSAKATVGFMFIGNSPRIEVWFEIEDLVTAGENRIQAIYIAKSLEKPGTGKIRGRVLDPQFTVGWRARLVRDLSVLFPQRYSPKCLPTSFPLVPEPIMVQTRTVRKDASGAERGKSFHYSVVERIVGWADTAEVHGFNAVGSYKSDDPGIDVSFDPDSDCDPDSDSDSDCDGYGFGGEIA